MTLAEYTRNPAPKPPRPDFEPVTMPSVFDAMIDLSVPVEQYDRTTHRLLLAGATLCLALLGAIITYAWGY